MKLLELKAELHSKILALRNVEAVIDKDQFERMWKGATEDEKDKLAKAGLAGRKEFLTNWLNYHPSLEYGELPVRRLKVLARQRLIRHYSRMPKEELILALKRRDVNDKG